ncbi:hypothetical protein QFC24_004527 [Naganishia onofrii]|uniref:Uncharacterized protein n=1 Tax=Naganishia onofrii TaxID=1851511 RepID=A0ACC2XD36_9TREE|nr:hypothetical protein QFC24_004527 [Naganishia onofrii]
MAERTYTSQSDPAPTAGMRPRTAFRRPRTSARRAQTARLDTSTSSIGELPDQTFFPEGEGDEDYFDEDEEEYISEEEDPDVFAFARPQTAAPPHMRAFNGASGLTTQNMVIHEAPMSPTSPTSPTVVNSSRPTTAFATLAGTVDDDGDKRPVTRGGELARVKIVESVKNASGSSQEDDGNSTFAAMDQLEQSDRTPLNVLEYAEHHPQSFAHSNTDSAAVLAAARRSSNPNNTALLTSIKANEARRHSAGRGSPHRGPTEIQGLNRNVQNKFTSQAPTTAQSGLSAKPSFTSNSSFDGITTDGGFSAYTTDVDDMEGPLRRKSQKHGYRMRNFDSSMGKDDLQAIPGSRDGSVWAAQSEIGGATTIPDGMTTKGDGLGNMYTKWDRDDSENLGYMDEAAEEEDSPFEEVRASVSNIDDPDMPGKFLAWVMPLKKFHLPWWRRRVTFDLNPGPFNIKENALIMIVANSSLLVSSVMHAATAVATYMHLDFHAGFTILFVLAAQLAGIGLAGFASSLLVKPASMIWPYNLVVTTFLNTFHAEEAVRPGEITRFRFFILAFIGAFVYYFIPGFLFTALSFFSWVCWIKPKNRVVNQLFGVNTGLGMGLLTFDWSQVIFVGSPLMVPWFAQANAMFGFLLFYWILCPILYYTNTLYSAYMPISTGTPVDRFGSPYNITAVLNSTAPGVLDEAAYHAYSPVYISVTFMMTFTLAFAIIPAIIVHTLLHHGVQIWRAIRRQTVEAPDIHEKLMQSYPGVPLWWSGILIVISLMLGIIAIEVYHTGYPVYMFLLSFAIPLVYFIPAGFLYATASQPLAINVIAELVPGYILPGNTVVNMLSKAFSMNSLLITVQIIQDMKLGHYMKIPPRSTFTGNLHFPMVTGRFDLTYLFIVQLVALIVSSFTQIVTKNILFSVVTDICSETQVNSFTCPFTGVWFNSGVLWGAISPARIFGAGAMYHGVLYALLAGAFIPIPFWYLGKRYPKSIWKAVNWGVILNSVTAIPPATGINYATFLLVGFIFRAF